MVAVTLVDLPRAPSVLVPWLEESLRSEFLIPTKCAEATVQFVLTVSDWMVASAGWSARHATAYV